MRHIIYQNNLQSSGSNLSEQLFGTCQSREENGGDSETILKII